MRTMTQAQIDEWNATFRVGHPCILIEDSGREFRTRIRSQAWLIMADLLAKEIKGKPIVKVEGNVGGWDLDRLRMLEVHKLEAQ